MQPIRPVTNQPATQIQPNNNQGANSTVSQIIQAQEELLQASTRNNDRTTCDILLRLLRLHPENHTLPERVRSRYFSQLQRTNRNIEDRIRRLHGIHPSNPSYLTINDELQMLLLQRDLLNTFLNPPRTGNNPEDTPRADEISQIRSQLLRAISRHDFQAANEPRQRLYRLNPQRYNLSEEDYAKYFYGSLLYRRMQAPLYYRMLNTVLQNEDAYIDLNRMFGRLRNLSRLTREFLNPPQLGNPARDQRAVTQITEVQTQLLEAIRNNNNEAVRRLLLRLSELQPQRYNLEPETYNNFSSQLESTTLELAELEGQLNLARRANRAVPESELIIRMGRSSNIYNALVGFLNRSVPNLNIED